MSPAANSSRWCPTPEQLMILEEMYRAGTRTPNASQIQQITAHLSFYGKIEGKNVFYWFQNHKARDRQKLRRKLYKQLQQQQVLCHHHHQQQQQQQLMINAAIQQSHHFLGYNIDNPASSSFHHQQLSCYNSSSSPSTGSILPGGVEDHHHQYASNHHQLKGYSWKMEIPLEKENSIMRMYDRDWTMIVDHVVPPNSPSCSSNNNNKPLKTLELFPIKSTNLKEECTTSKHLPFSSSTTK